MRQLLHISDVHFGPPHRSEIADGVVELVARRRPDRVVISGDLTQRAQPEQFRAARAFVDRLAVDALVVPGNHDVPLYHFWDRAFRPFHAYRRHFANQLEPSFEDDEMLLVGINTAHGWTQKEGRITRSTLRRVAHQLRQAPPGAAKIIVAHHQLIPAPRYGDRRVLVGAYEALDVFSRHGVDLVLSGHLHQAYFGTSESYQPSSERPPVVILHSGTTTSDRGRGCERGRNTGNWIRIERDEIVISHLEWDAASRRFHELSRHHFPRPARDPYALETF